MTRRRTLAIALAAPAALALLAGLFLAWLTATGGGLGFALRVAAWALPGVAVDAPAGTLLGPLRLGRIAYETPERRLVLEEVALDWQPRQLLEGLLFVDRLDIGRLLVLSRPSEKPPSPPADLTLPLSVRVEQFHVGEAAFGPLAAKAPPAPQVTALGGGFASDGRQHRLDHLQFATGRLAVRASGKLGGQAPFPVTAKGQVSGEELGQPFTVDVGADGNLGALLVQARSTQGKLRVIGQGRLDLFAPQPLRQGSLVATGLDPAAWVAGAPHARLSVDARLSPPGEGAGPLAGQVSVANGEPGRLDEARLPLRRLEARLVQAGEALEVPDFTATLTGGDIRGSARWARGQLAVDARLSRVDAARWHVKAKPTSLSGSLQAQASAAAQQVKADLRDPRFRLALDATRREGIVHVATARVAARGGSLEAAGRFDPRGDYDLSGRLRNFDPAAFAAVPGGRLNATLTARGRLGDKPAMDLHFALQDSQLDRRPVAGQGDVLLTPERLEKADISLRAGDNRVQARGALGAPKDRLTLAIDAPRLDQVGLGGSLQGEAALFGPLRSPGAEWKLRSPRLDLPGGTRLRDFTSEGRLAPGAAAIQAELAAALLETGGESPSLAGITASIAGERDRHRLQVQARVGEDHALALAAAGGLDANRVWRGQVDTLEWRGANPVRLAGPASLEAGPGRLVVGRAVVAGEDWRAALDGLSWQPGRLRSAGRLTGLPVAAFLPAAAPITTLRLGGDWDIDFGQGAAGRVRLFRQSGDLALKTADETLTLGLERLSLLATFSGRQAELALDGYGRRAGTLGGRLTAGLSPAGGMWTLARQAPWQGSLQLDTPSLAWLSPLAGENVLLGGRLQGAVRIGGTPAAPAVNGQLSGSGLRVRLLDYGLDLGGGSLRLDFTPETARLERLEMTSVASQRPAEPDIDFRRLTARPGRLVAEGEMALQQGAGSIRLRADQLAVSQLPDRWVMVSGSGGLRFTEGQLNVDGDLKVDAAYVELPSGGRPTLSRDVVVLGREKAASQGVRIALEANLDLGDSFHFRGAGIESRLAGAIHLAAARRDQLRARGSVHTVGGTFDAYGRELSIERGILNFQGLVDNPGLNVRALRKNLPVEAGVEVTGTLKDPKVTLVSEPAVPDPEKLSWMVLGRPPGEAVGSQDASLLLSAAMALRGGNQGKGPLQSLMQGLGLEEFSLASGTLGERSRFPASHVAGSFAPGGGATSAEQIATIGKRISSNAVLSYERSITSAESILKLTVELTRRFSLVGRIGANNALGFLYSFAFGGGAKPERAGRK